MATQINPDGSFGVGNKGYSAGFFGPGVIPDVVHDDGSFGWQGRSFSKGFFSGPGAPDPSQYIQKSTPTPTPTPTGGGDAPTGGGGGPVEGLANAGSSVGPGSAAGAFDLPPVFNIGTPSQANPSLGQRNLPLSGLVLSRRSY